MCEWQCVLAAATPSDLALLFLSSAVCLPMCATSSSRVPLSITEAVLPGAVLTGVLCGCDRDAGYGIAADVAGVGLALGVARSLHSAASSSCRHSLSNINKYF